MGLKTFKRLWCLIPKCSAYFYRNIGNNWYVVGYVWLWGRKWEIWQVRGEEEKEGEGAGDAVAGQ